MARRLAIFVPLARQHGLGHYYRNAGLMRACQDAFYLTDQWEVRVPEMTVRVESLDPERLEAQLHRLNVGALLIDHYFLPEGLVARLARRSTRRYRIIFFDRDCANPELDALLNSNPFCRSTDFRPRHSSTHYFVGGEYLWLRPEVERCSLLDVHEKQERLLVCMGGSDRRCLMVQLLPELRCAGLPLVIVVGAGCTPAYADQLRQLASRLGLDAEIHHDPPDFPVLLNGTRFALIPTSTLCYEALHLGCQVIALQTEAHQARLARFLEEQGLHVLLPASLSKLRRALTQCNFQGARLNMGSKTQELVSYVQEALAA